MDDRTKDTLDALADLFLTGVKPTAGGAAPPPSAKPGPQHALSPAPAPMPAAMPRPMPAPPLRTLGDTNPNAAADPLDAPRPLRLPPKMRSMRMPGGPRTFVQQDPPSDAPSGGDDRVADRADAGESPVYGRAEGVDDAASAAGAETSKPPRQRVWRHRPAGGRVVKAADAAAMQPSERPVRVEAVFLGNLPGFGRPWLTQYAHYLAQRGGRVAILHIDAGGGDAAESGHIEVEVVTAAGPNEPAIPALHLAGTEPFDGDAEDGDAEHAPATAKPPIDPSSLAGLLESLTRPGTMRVSRVLVHLPGAESAADLAPAMELKRWTVLSGADDAAVAGAARLIQRLVDDDKSGSDGAPGAGRARRIGVMVMGSDEERARNAARRIGALAAEAAQGGVRLVGAMRQMVPVNVRVLGSFAADNPGGAADAPGSGGVMPMWRSALATLKAATRPGVATRKAVAARRLLRRIARAGDLDATTAAPSSPAPAASPAPTAPSRSNAKRSRGSTPPPVSDNAFAAGLADGPTVSRIVETVTEAAINSAAAWHAMHRGEAAHADSESRANRAAPAMPSTPAPPAEWTEPPPDDLDLSQYLAERGLVRLDARSPRHPRIQLVLDQQGRVHVLARHTGDSGAGDLRDAFIELLGARAWLLEHRDLLALTQRQCRFADAAPVLHLFTDQPKLAIGLINRLGDHLKLHLLQHLGAAEHATWYCTELN